jgi:hypothetical protein
MVEPSQPVHSRIPAAWLPRLWRSHQGLDDGGNIHTRHHARGRIMASVRDLPRSYFYGLWECASPDGIFYFQFFENGSFTFEWASAIGMFSKFLRLMQRVVRGVWILERSDDGVDLVIRGQEQEHSLGKFGDAMQVVDRVASSFDSGIGVARSTIISVEPDRFTTRVVQGGNTASNGKEEVYTRQT